MPRAALQPAGPRARPLARRFPVPTATLVALLPLALLGAPSARAAGAAAGGASGGDGTAPASYLDPGPPHHVSKSSQATRWASLSPGQCRAELARRKLAVKRWHGAASGVATPVRVTGPIGGVRFVTPGGKSPYGILDCRLALAFSDLAEVLRRHDVVEVHVDNMYRPHAHLPGKKKPSQHSYGLAVDMTRLERADGTELVIDRDFEGKLGEPVCGEGARPRSELAPDAVALRDLICDVARAELFHHILTPNHDAAHHNHFHLDIARGARELIIE